MTTYPRLILIWLACSIGRTAAGQVPLASLWQQKQYFQMRKAFHAQYPTLKPFDRLLFGAVIDNAFNHPERSAQAIRTLHKGYGQHLTFSLRKQVLNLEADNAIKTCRYRQAAEAYRLVINYCRTDSAEKADLQNSIALWSAIAAVPPQQVIHTQNASLHWHKDKIGLINLAVGHATDTCQLVFDTGANISVITESNAKKLRMRTHPVKLDLGAGTTGQTVQSSLAVADSLWFGPILLRHVVFLLLPDQMLEFKQNDYRQQGIIGEPVVAQLGQLTFHRDGRLDINLKPTKPKDEPNLALDGAMPIVEYTVNGQRLPFRFDSGASNSVLYAPFYRRFENLVKATGKAYQLRTGGVGGTINTAAAFKLAELNLSVGGKTFALPQISVRTTPVGSEPDQFYGNMGLDLFKGFRDLTIDLQGMYIRVQ